MTSQNYRFIHHNHIKIFPPPGQEIYVVHRHRISYNIVACYTLILTYIHSEPRRQRPTDKLFISTAVVRCGRLGPGGALRF